MSLTNEDDSLVRRSNDPAPSLSVNPNDDVLGGNNIDSKNYANVEASSNLTMSSSRHELSFYSSTEQTVNLTPANDLMSNKLGNQFRCEVPTITSTCGARKMNALSTNPACSSTRYSPKIENSAINLMCCLHPNVEGQIRDRPNNATIVNKILRNERKLNVTFENNNDKPLFEDKIHEKCKK